MGHVKGSWRGSLDLAVAVALAVSAALATLLPEGSAVRVLVTLPVLLLVPGFLTLQAVLGRAWKPVQMLLAAGVSLPIIGLLALSTVLFPAGFRPAAIVMAVTVGCVVLAAVALLRRILQGRAAVPQAA